MGAQQVVKVYVEAAIIGTGAFENVDAARCIELGNPPGLAVELFEPGLDVAETWQADIHGFAQLVIDVAWNLMCCEARIVPALKIAKVCERIAEREQGTYPCSRSA